MWWDEANTTATPTGLLWEKMQLPTTDRIRNLLKLWTPLSADADTGCILLPSFASSSQFDFSIAATNTHTHTPPSPFIAIALIFILHNVHTYLHLIAIVIFEFIHSFIHSFFDLPGKSCSILWLTAVYVCMFPFHMKFYEKEKKTKKQKYTSRIICSCVYVKECWQFVFIIWLKISSIELHAFIIHIYSFGFVMICWIHARNWLNIEINS